jgi:hypothetical protein
VPRTSPGPAASCRPRRRRRRAGRRGTRRAPRWRGPGTGRRLVADLADPLDEQPVPVGDVRQAADAVHGLRGAVDEFVGAAGHAQPAPGAGVRAQRQPGPADGQPQPPDALPVGVVALQHRLGPRAQRGQPAARVEQREGVREVVVLRGQGHLVERGPVVPLHLVPGDRPAVERAAGEGHRLRAPDVREAAVGGGHHVEVRAGLPGAQARGLAEVAERVVRAVGPLLRHPAGPAGCRGGRDGAEGDRVPGGLVAAGELLQRRAPLGLEPAAEVEHGDVLVRVARQGQRHHRGGGTRADDEVGPAHPLSSPALVARAVVPAALGGSTLTRGRARR